MPWAALRRAHGGMSLRWGIGLTALLAIMLLPVATIAVAERAGILVGFVTVDPQACYLDQIVVAPEAQRLQCGQLLLDAAKHIGREGLYLHVNKDNTRALNFYQKCGFTVAGEDVNRRSGAPVYMMTWRPAEATSP